jgi:hypothetical protein
LPCPGGALISVEIIIIDVVVVVIAIAMIMVAALWDRYAIGQGCPVPLVVKLILRV